MAWVQSALGCAEFASRRIGGKASSCVIVNPRIRLFGNGSTSASPLHEVTTTCRIVLPFSFVLIRKNGGSVTFMVTDLRVWLVTSYDLRLQPNRAMILFTPARNEADLDHLARGLLRGWRRTKVQVIMAPVLPEPVGIVTMVGSHLWAT